MIIIRNFINNSPFFSNLVPTLTVCLGDTTSVTISHPTLTGVANASLRLTYNPDSLTYLGFNSLNPAFNGMAINGTNGVITMDWNTSSNQTIAAGNLVNLRFRVNGNSNLTWDTLIVPSEFYDSAFNLVPQTFSSGSINHRTTRLVWNRNICEGQSFTLGNQSYTTSGTYQGRTFGTGGACDTLITLNLNVLPRQTNPSVTICSNQPYSFNGLQLNSSGVYLDTLVNILLIFIRDPESSLRYLPRQLLYHIYDPLLEFRDDILEDSQCRKVIGSYYEPWRFNYPVLTREYLRICELGGWAI
jgi:hypothetical protein